jgi:hypothetical protein
MKLQMADLKTERQWRAATGFDQVRFERLLELFTRAYRELYGQDVMQRRAALKIKPSLTSEAELLYFTLFSLKSGLAYDLLGIIFEMAEAEAKSNQELGLVVLKECDFVLMCNLKVFNFSDLQHTRQG